MVYPAASLVGIARGAKARIIEINVAETPISGEVNCSLRGPAGEILPKLVA